MHYSDHSNDVALEIVSSSDDQPRVLLSAVLVGKSAAAPGDKDRTRHVVINGIMDSVQFLGLRPDNHYPVRTSRGAGANS